MSDPVDRLTQARRIERAERAAAGACGHLMEYVATTDAFFKTWADETATIASKGDVLEALRAAHNGALAWAKAESARIHARLGEA